MRPLFQALAHTSDGAFVIDEQHQIIFWNQAAEKLLGYTAEEVAGLHCYEILGGRDEQGHTLCQRYCRLAVSARQGEPLPNPDILARTQEGEGQWINVTTFLYPARDPELGAVIVHLFRDATIKKSNERFIQKIREASRELRDGNAPPLAPLSTGESAAHATLSTLTPREQQVLSLLAQGLGTDEMAETLHISPSTTSNHVQNILRKLNVHSRLEAVTFVYQHGLVETVGPPANDGAGHRSVS